MSDRDAIADRFGAVVARVTDWDAPTPVADWRARDVVHHLTTWLPGFLAGCGVDLPAGVREDPVGSWKTQDAAVRELIAERGQDRIDHPMAGGGTLTEVLERIYVPDVFMHTWDLARASGQDDRLDPRRCTDMVQGMRSMEEMLRGSGQFGVQQPVPDDADPTDQLVAFIGRDPRWRPPA